MGKKKHLTNSDRSDKCPDEGRAAAHRLSPTEPVRLSRPYKPSPLKLATDAIADYERAYLGIPTVHNLIYVLLEDALPGVYDPRQRKTKGDSAIPQFLGRELQLDELSTQIASGPLTQEQKNQAEDAVRFLRLLSKNSFAQLICEGYIQKLTHRESTVAPA